MKLNHNLILSTDLDDMVHFWTNVIGLTVGERPPFPFKGEWLYSKGKPLIHLAEQANINPHAGAIAHIALEGAVYKELLARIKTAGASYTEKNVPASGERQVFVQGPDGLVVEMLFPLAETVDNSADSYEYACGDNNYDYLGGQVK